MILKVVFLLVLLSLSQVAVSLLQIRSLEILESRQFGCSICTTVADTFTHCRSVECVCNPTFAADLQSCFNCAVEANPSPENVGPIQKSLDDYARACPDVPRITISLRVPSTQTGTTTRSSSFDAIALATTSLSMPTTSSITQSSAAEGKQACMAAITAMMGAALVFGPCLWPDS